MTIIEEAVREDNVVVPDTVKFPLPPPVVEIFKEPNNVTAPEISEAVVVVLLDSLNPYGIARVFNSKKAENPFKVIP